MALQREAECARGPGGRQGQDQRGLGAPIRLRLHPQSGSPWGPSKPERLMCVPRQRGWHWAQPSQGSGPLPGIPLSLAASGLGWLPPPTLPLWKLATGGWILWGIGSGAQLGGSGQQRAGEQQGPSDPWEDGGLGGDMGSGGPEMTTAAGTPAPPTRAAAGTVMLPLAWGFLQEKQP